MFYKHSKICYSIGKIGGHSMELRVLQYFLAIAREQSISGAAEFLHISQPTLSRQIKDMEEELGKQLFIRGNRRIELTEEGMLLRRRAEEIINLTKKTEKEIMNADRILAGDIYIGAGETAAIEYVAKAAAQLKEKHPAIHYHISSDDAFDIQEHLDKGLIDFGIIIGNIDKTKYDYLVLPVKDSWGILMKKDAPLANNDYIQVEDLENQPLIISRQISDNHNISSWFPKGLSNCNITSTYNLVYNATYMAAQGNGYILTLDKLINTTGDSKLCFRPLRPSVETDIYIIWKKYQTFSKAAEEFLKVIRSLIDQEKK